MAVGNIEKYNDSLSPEQRRQAAKRASDASAKKRTAAKLWKESVENLMRGTLTKEDEQEIRQRFGLSDDVELSQQDKVVAAVSKKAQAGDKDAAQFLRDTAGQSPAQLLKVGNLDDKPFATLDLGSLSDEDLRRLADRESPEE